VLKSLPKRRKHLPLVGWREWVTLDELGLPPIKAKIDTGARTSALHAFRLESFVRDNEEFVRFFVHPIQRRRKPEIACEARVIERRQITSSTGHREMRYVIETMARIGDVKIPIEITLTNRDEMGFRMLIGREAVKRRFLVDPSASFMLGKE
jgi:hypothetical protein